MTTKLNQIIAVEKGVKSRVYAKLTELNKLIQKPDLFNGFNKVYQKLNEEGEQLPPENKKVQNNVVDILQILSGTMSEVMEVTARKDWTNRNAIASVKVDGKVLIEDVPVSYLLFLEKNLTDVRTFIGNLPVLDETENWKENSSSGLYSTNVLQTHRTKKLQRPIVLYEATAAHPAQTQLITEDILVGFWNQTKVSGAISKVDKEKILVRVEKLLKSVKEAREEANIIDEVSSPEVGKLVFSYILNT